MRVTGNLNAIPGLTLMRYLLMTKGKEAQTQNASSRTMTAHTSNSTLVDFAVAQAAEIEFLMVNSPGGACMSGFSSRSACDGQISLGWSSGYR